MAKHICFLLDFYPTKDNHACIFAKNLIYAIADKGIKCTVISPQAITPSSIKKKYPLHHTEKTPGGQTIDIYMPYYVYVTSKKLAIIASMNNHYLAVLGIIRRYKIKPDIMYGHFFFQCGLTASRVGKKLGIPSYCACGENSTRLAKDSEPYTTGLKYGNWKQIISDLSGIISVSSYNKRLLIENGFSRSGANISVFPNGVDTNLFKKTDKQKARESLGLPADKYIVVFNGTFSERKGFLKVCEALNKCDEVYSIFIGSDTVKPDCKNVLFSGRVQPERVPEYLNAADVFVLPTKGEGCCNAIVEALSCGLPVISSALPFNDDILNETNSIQIDPDNVDEIKYAIISLKSPGKREKLIPGNLVDCSVVVRAEKILKFMGA